MTFYAFLSFLMKRVLKRNRMRERERKLVKSFGEAERQKELNKIYRK